jgi:hypothetical protein
MTAFKESIETLRLAVEKRQHVNARLKEKVFVPEVQQGNLKWEGHVFSFHLIYDTKNSGATKEQIAAWSLPGPNAETLDAAEQRGEKLRKRMLDTDVRSPEIRRRAKLAYAWSSPVKGSREREFHIVLHEGAVKSASDAVKAVMAKS